MTFLGLTWDHPRGYDALAEAARRVNAGRKTPLIDWVKQPLEGFESAPIADLAAAHDLIVLDHPHIGEAVAEDCLTPLDELFPAEQIEQWANDSIGPSLASYRWNGRTWAVPLDVATQVVARRPDQISDAPQSWEEIEEIAKDRPVALSLGGPHAFLNLISLCASTGFVAGGDALLPNEPAWAALDRLGRLARAAPEGSSSHNPITLLEIMARGDEIAMIPLIFGYVTYARSGHAPWTLAFSDTPRAPGGFGGVLGGTGIGFSRHATPTREILNHIIWLMSQTTQVGLFPDFGGQPSARAAWQNPKINAEWGNFYAATASTAETALLRPRFDGYISFQTAASAQLRDAFADAEDPETTLKALRTLWRHARQGARGLLDPKG